MSCCARLAAGLQACVAVAALAASAPTHAAGAWSAAVTGTSDYVFRGVSLSYGHPVLQGGLNYQSQQGWFVGAWGSRVEPYPYEQHAIETDVYAGMGWQLSPRWSARATYTRYLYLRDERPRPYDYGELAVSLGFEDRIAATLSYQPDATHRAEPGYVRGRPSWSCELAGQWPLWKRLSVVGSAGYYDLKRLYGVGYTAGGAGLRFTHRHLEFELMHFVTDHAVGQLYDESSANGRWAGSVTARF
jgi:uncharacterized protein (TIGR02001 family)